MERIIIYISSFMLYRDSRARPWGPASAQGGRSTAPDDARSVDVRREHALWSRETLSRTRYLARLYRVRLALGRIFSLLFRDWSGHGSAPCLHAPHWRWSKGAIPSPPPSWAQNRSAVELEAANRCSGTNEGGLAMVVGCELEADIQAAFQGRFCLGHVCLCLYHRALTAAQRDTQPTRLGLVRAVFVVEPIQLLEQ